MVVDDDVGVVLITLVVLLLRLFFVFFVLIWFFLGAPSILGAHAYDTPSSSFSFSFRSRFHSQPLCGIGLSVGLTV